jgi:hypothetical protein
MDLALDLNENDPWTIISAALGFAFAGEDRQAPGALVAQARSRSGCGIRARRRATSPNTLLS